MKRLLGIVLLLLVWVGVAGAQATPTATPTGTPLPSQSPTPTATATPSPTPTPVGPAMCSVSGQVVNADGSPFKNGTITFNSQRIQVINTLPVNPTVVTTNTDNNGNILAKAMPQGLVMQVTICPGTQQTSNCSAPFSVIIPFAPTANFGSLSQGTQLTGTSAASFTTLSVTGTLTYPDGSTYTTAGHNSMASVGIGQTVGSDPLDITRNQNGGTFAGIFNNSTGTNAQAGVWINSGTSGTNVFLVQNGSGNTSSGNAVTPANSGYLYADAGVGIIAGYMGNGVNIGVGGALQGSFNGGEYQAVHIGNNETQATPTVDAPASINANSRDTFGEITSQATNGQITIHFVHPFPSGAFCNINANGQAHLWWNCARSGTAVTFCCTIPNTGAACSGNLDITYACWNLN